MASRAKDRRVPPKYRKRDIENIVLSFPKNFHFGAVFQKYPEKTTARSILKWVEQIRELFIKERKEFLSNAALIEMVKTHKNSETIINIINQKVEDVC